MPARGFLRTVLLASFRKSERVSLHSMSTEPAPATQPITSGFSSAGVANSYSTTEHCRLSQRTPIATRVECCISIQDCYILQGLYVRRHYQGVPFAGVLNLQPAGNTVLLESGQVHKLSL